MAGRKEQGGLAGTGGKEGVRSGQGLRLNREEKDEQGEIPCGWVSKTSNTEESNTVFCFRNYFLL